MQNLPKTMEMDPVKQGQMVSLPGSETGASMRSSSGQPFHQKTNPMPWGLMNFYGGEQPWVPQGIFAGAQQSRQVIASGNQRRANPSGFQGWRSTLPSECDTVPPEFPPSDSGYESRTKHSVENASVFNDVDRSQDTQSLSGHIMDFHPFGMTPSDGNWDVVATPVPVAHVGAVENRLICPDCRALCKTKSELNKHNQRHRKAYRCNVPGCARKEGFGTMNDLDRHRGSVHPTHFNAGPRYRCQIGSCQTKDKIWPRADNFRQHLKRVHHQHVSPEDDLSEYILQSPTQRPQEDPFQQNAQDALEGVGSDLFNSYNAGPMAWDGRPPAFEDIQLSPQEERPVSMDLILDPSLTSVDGPLPNVSLDSSDVDMAVPKAQLQNQTSNPDCDATRHEFVQPEEITKTPSPKTLVGGQKDDGSDGLNQPQRTPINLSLDHEQDAPGPSSARNETVDCSTTDSMDFDDNTKVPFPRAPEESSGKDRSVEQEIAQEDQSMDQFPSVLSNKGLDRQAMFDLLSRVPKNIIETFLKSQTENTPQKISSTPNSNSENQHRCPSFNCRKVFNRKCELKKHMKRHDKPYGCTFSNCKKKFGSKNDWKRHENSQHFQVEMWKCHEKQADDENESCGKVCHRRETFRSHLSKEHKMDDTAQVDKALERCRVGRNGEPRFWCGFCVKIVEIAKKGASAWAERFNHIDNHYAGRHNLPKKVHSEWVAVDPELPEMDLTGSPDDSSDVDSADDGSVTVVSRKPEITINAAKGQTRKRSLNDDGGQPGPKRVKTFMWCCCSCTWGDAVVKLHASCINCTHVRCDDCKTSWVTTQDVKDANSTNKSQA